MPGLPLLLAAERLLTGCHLSVDVVLGDVVKVGVGLESKLQESFQGAPDVISPRSGPSGRYGVLGIWVGELGTHGVDEGTTHLLGWSWKEIRRK